MRSRVITAQDGTRLHVGETGTGPDVVVLSGGPGCVQYLEDDGIAPVGFRAWYPEPRGVGRSAGGGHTMAQAVEDLEAVRQAVAVRSWIVLGHSWGSDLAVFYALRHPDSVAGVVGIAGTGIQRDRTWSEEYDARKDGEPKIPVPWVPEVHAALLASYQEWIHQPRVLRQVADSTVPMLFVAAASDIRPSWPLEQLAELAPHGRFTRIPDVPHDFWATHPSTWVHVVTDACAELTPSLGHHGRVPVTVRRAGAEDGPFLAEMLVAAAYWRQGGPGGTVEDVMSQPDLARYVAGWPRPGDLGVIAEDGGPVGAAWLRFLPLACAGYGYVDDDTPELSIGVRADRRGLGIGTSLLTELLAAARTLGLHRVSLSVERDNPARRLYEGAGFTAVGTNGGSDTMLWTA